MTTRAQVAAEARSWLKTPWRHQGRTVHGIDCAGLVIVVAKTLGLADYDTTAYGRNALGQSFQKHFADNMDKIPLTKIDEGDVLLFRDKQFPCHSSIVGKRLDALTIIHAHASRRMVVEDLLDQGDWIERRVAGFRFRNLED